MKLLSYSSRLQVRFSEERGLFFDEEERQNAPEVPPAERGGGRAFRRGFERMRCLPLLALFTAISQHSPPSY